MAEYYLPPHPDADPFADTLPVSYISDPQNQTYLHYGQHYPPSRLSPSYDHDPHFYPEVLPAESGGHLRHDVEAYASGNYSRASYRPPRSRSPTPAVDDEDYQIVGNDSIHYTGHPGHFVAANHSYDPEKAILENDANLMNVQYASGQILSHSDGQKTPMDLEPPETPVETRHFGPAPAGRVVRRHKSKKRVQLTNGNLVVDVNVPPKLMLPRKGEPETMRTRYTAVTCDPDDFEKNGFFLRQNENGRKTELFIVVTMYNVSICLLFEDGHFYVGSFRRTRCYFVGQCTA
jgi:chitin synthase